MAETTTSKPDAPVTIENVEQASSNFYWMYQTESGSYNLQTTLRGILSPAQVQAHTKMMLEAIAHVHSLGGQARQASKYSETPAAPLPESIPSTDTVIVSTVLEPTYVPIETPEVKTGVVATQNDTFDAVNLAVTITNGKKYFHVKGGAWMKFGVVVWDEVLAAAGISAAKLKGPDEVPEGYDLKGYKATFTRKADGKPNKVIKLEKIVAAG